MSKNKVAQAQRRAMRQSVDRQFNIINRAIKPRPRFFPPFLWRMCARIFIDIKYLRQFYGG